MTRRTKVFYIELGAKIKARRRKLGITQQVLAECIGCVRPHIPNMESGASAIPLHTLYAIAVVLDTTPNKLLPKYY